MSTIKVFSILSLLTLAVTNLNVIMATEDLYNLGEETHVSPVSSSIVNTGWGHKHGPDCKKEAKSKGWGSYNFGYAVEDKYTGDYKSHKETRHNGWTKGSYSLVQPDGILRTVVYEAGPGKGFKAVVYNKGWGWTNKAIKGHEKNEEKQAKAGWGY